MEWGKGPGVEATLSWEDLDEPFMVNIPKEKSATGKHALHSLFVDDRRVTATVNGRTLMGEPVPRELAGRQTSTVSRLPGNLDQGLAGMTGAQGACGAAPPAEPRSACPLNDSDAFSTG